MGAFRTALARATLAAVLAFVPAVAEAMVEVPPLRSRVTDLAGLLAPAQQDALEKRLATFEAMKGSQIAVLIVPTTRPEEIEQFSIRVVDQWKLGRKGVDDGALLVVATDDRRLRIEVGRGLEGVVPDIAARRIVADTITPHFRRGDLYAGIEAGVTQLIGLVEGEPLPEPSRRRRQPNEGVGGLLPMLLALSVMAGSLLRRVMGRLPGAMTTGGIVGFLAWVLAGVVFVGVFAGVLGFVIALMGSGSGPGWSNGRRGGFGFPMGGGYRGGFGGGGFRGGGGGFSGGGASGRW